MSAIPFLIIDVLPADSYAAEHVPGAVNICVYETAFLDKVRAVFPDPASVLTVYGLNHSTREAETAQAKLAEAGYQNVTVLPGGLVGWKARGGEVESSVEASAPAVSVSGTYPVDASASFIRWTGRNLFNFHTGTLLLGGGSVTIEDGQLRGGHFTVDMTSLGCADITDSRLNALLIAHLASDDFFHTSEYPVARFSITAVAFLEEATLGVPNYIIRGELSLRGVTLPIEFPAVVAQNADGAFIAQAVFEIDRTLWGAEYGSGKLFARLGQHLVNDFVQLHLKIVTAAKAE